MANEKIMRQNETNLTLSKKQIEVAQMLANPEFEGKKTDIISKTGVSHATLYRWLGDDEFKKYVSELIDEYTDAELGDVWKALIKRCKSGDIQAIKLYFELKGKYNQNVNLKADSIVQIIDDIPEGEDNDEVN